MSRLLVGLVPVLVLAVMLPASRSTRLAAVQAEEAFELSIVAANCEREPSSFPFQGGDCVPAVGAVIVVTTADGELIGTCIAEAVAPDAVIAVCSVPVPFGSAVVVTEDVSTIPQGYAPTSNPQPFDVPATRPDGAFGGPVFLNLPDSTEATPVQQPTVTATIQEPLSACSAPPLPTPALDASLNLPGYVAIFIDGAMFMEWTEVGGSLHGTLYVTGPDAESPDGLETLTIAFTGVQSGDRLTLTIPQGFGFSTMLPGLLDGDSLTLYLTDDSENLTSVVLHRGTLAEYDQAVRALRLQAIQATACAREAAARSAMHRGDAARTGRQPGPGPQGFPIADARFAGGTVPGRATSSPVAVRGTVYVGMENAPWGAIVALDTTTGQPRWRFEADYFFRQAPAVADGLVYAVGTRPANGQSVGALYALDTETGKERWRFDLNIEPLYSPAIASGLVYIGTADGMLYAVDTADGTERWHVRLGLLPLTTWAVANGTVFVISGSDGIVFAVQAKTGELLWRTELDATVNTVPTVNGGLLYVSTSASYLYALNTETGNVRWDHFWWFGTGLSPAVDAGVVFTTRTNGVVNAYDAATGADIWTFETGDSGLGNPSVGDGVVYVASTSGTLYAIDSASGEELWTYSTPVIAGDGIVSSPVVLDGVVFVVNADGILSAVAGSEKL